MHVFVNRKFLNSGDVQQRIEDHLGGKQHLGYAKIGSTIEELRVSANIKLNFLHKT